MFTDSIVTNAWRLVALSFPACVVYVIVKELTSESSLIPIGVGVAVATIWGLLFPKVLGLKDEKEE